MVVLSWIVLTVIVSAALVMIAYLAVLAWRTLAFILGRKNEDGGQPWRIALERAAVDIDTLLETAFVSTGWTVSAKVFRVCGYIGMAMSLVYFARRW